MAADPALVVSLEARLNRFEKQLREAGNIADREVGNIEDRFSRLNPQAGASFLGNFLSNFATKGIDAAIKFVTDLKDRFIDLNETAHLVGATMNEVFGFQEAAAKAKVPVEDVTKSVRGLATLLDQMQRGEQNTLTALFDANPAALQGVNREALNLQETFKIIGDLVQNARTEIQKVDISAAAGQAQTMVRFLEQGGAAVVRLSNDAAAAAPDLQRLADGAKAFDDAWQNAVKNVKAFAAERAFDIIKTDLQDIITLLGGAVNFLGLFKGGLIETGSAVAQLEKVRNALVGIQNARTQIDESAGLNTGPNAREDIRGGSARTGGGTSTLDTRRGLSNVPLKPDTGGGEGEDTFDRQISLMEKRIAVMNADTATLGLNSEARERAKTVAVLEEAAKRANSLAGMENTAVTAAQRAEIDRVADAMEKSAEQARLAADQFNKINAASAQLGSALSTAFADAIVEGKNLNDVMSSLIKTLEKAAINSLFSSIFNAPTGGGLSPAANLLKGIIPGFAEGTDSAPGGLAWVGERGRELVNLPRGSQVIPNDVSRKIGGSSFAPVYNINAAGADAGTVARIQSVLSQHARAIQGTARSMQSSQRFQLTGVA